MQLQEPARTKLKTVQRQVDSSKTGSPAPRVSRQTQGPASQDSRNELVPAKVKGVKISFDHIEFRFDDGTRISSPLDKYPYPRNGTNVDRAKWEEMRWWVWGHLAKMRHAKVHRYRTSRSRLNTPLLTNDHIKI